MGEKISKAKAEENIGETWLASLHDLLLLAFKNKID